MQNVGFELYVIIWLLVFSLSLQGYAVFGRRGACPHTSIVGAEDDDNLHSNPVKKLAPDREFSREDVLALIGIVQEMDARLEDLERISKKPQSPPRKRVPVKKK